jgi:hypothetical protein
MGANAMRLFRCAVLLGIVAVVPVARAQNSPEDFPFKPASIAVYVSALNGNDSWSGLLPYPNCPGIFFHCTATDGPFATFERARAYVQSLDKSGLARISIQFRGGTYFLPATEMLTSADSGSPSTEISRANRRSSAAAFAFKAGRT